MFPSSSPRMRHGIPQTELNAHIHRGVQVTHHGFTHENAPHVQHIGLPPPPNFSQVFQHGPPNMTVGRPPMAGPDVPFFDAQPPTIMGPPHSGQPVHQAMFQTSNPNLQFPNTSDLGPRMPPPFPNVRESPHETLDFNQRADMNIRSAAPPGFNQPPFLIGENGIPKSNSSNSNYHSFQPPPMTYGNVTSSNMRGPGNMSAGMMPVHSAQHRMDPMDMRNNKHDHMPGHNMMQYLTDDEDKSDSYYDKYQRENDQNWVQNWLKKHGKLKTMPLLKKSSDISTVEYKFPDVQKAFHQSILLLAKLHHQYQSLEALTITADPQVWESEKNLTEEYKDKCMDVYKYLNNDEMLATIKSKTQARRRKRMRVKRRKKEEYEMKVAADEKRDQRHKQLEEWREKMTQQAEHEKQKEELKKSADATLSSVRKKISDAKKTQDFLKALQKLRKVRRVAAINQGRYASDVYDNNFEKKMKLLTSLIETQQTVYESEERTLKVMLDTVEEETMERDKEIKRLKELAKEKRDKKLATEKLFGKKAAVSEDTELFPFYSYYTQAEHSIEALVQIRSVHCSRGLVSAEWSGADQVSTLLQGFGFSRMVWCRSGQFTAPGVWFQQNGLVQIRSVHCSRGLVSAEWSDPRFICVTAFGLTHWEVTERYCSKEVKEHPILSYYYTQSVMVLQL
ncbi:uncharacterized protein LOC124136938 isoform X1 [Haliotis rufescens]|uniref:uncharacterized protein LOC124136938 isoform X1 n=1 Tax=Haliotis rufescens TaxID=6454 RepID=UPI00201FAEF7|nr:uncharacterized protein LOC124136938 isoform X1 [Haliotis rufescens]